MIKGSVVALVTPFDKFNQVDYKKLKELLKFHIEQGTDAILLFGTTGEGSTLSIKEKIKIAKVSIKYVGNKIPIILNVGTNSTSVTLMNIKLFNKLHPSAYLVITPYYNKGNDEGIFLHYQYINKASKIPIIIYNVPSRTGVDLSIELIEKISKLSNVIGIKETSTDIEKLIQLSKIQNENFYWISGNDSRLIEDYKMGAKGLIGVVTNTHPKAIKEIIVHLSNNNFIEAEYKMCRISKYIKSLSIDVNPIPIKEAMNILGYNVGGYRLPLYFLSPEKRKALAKCIEVMNE